MSTGRGRSPQESPIACRLTDREQDERQEKLARGLLSGREEVHEFDDGYELVFPGGAEWAEKPVSFVVSERECCPFSSPSRCCSRPREDTYR